MGLMGPPTDTRAFQQYDPNNATAQRQIGSSSIGVLLPNNPYRAEAMQAMQQNVADGLSGMAMGYTKNGIPHNDPRVVDAYLKNIARRFEGTGITPTVERLAAKAEATQAKIAFSRDGARIGEATRHFTPEGVEAATLDSLLPRGEKMGVMPYLYPAEAQFQRVYGGELKGQFINPITSRGFQQSNPEARVESLVDARTGQSYGDFIKAKYKGLMDFPTE